MDDELFFLLRPEFPAPTPMYGRRPVGEGTGDIESLFSHFLSLAHDHRLTPKKVIDLVLPEVLAKLPRFEGTRLAWGWDKHTGKEMIGSGHVAERWSTILASATGQNGLHFATLVPLAAHVYGDMTTDQDRVCHQCLADDEAQGRLPYGRLLWRMKCVTCCPIHRCALVTPTLVAERLRVDIAALAQHADLYAEVREATRNRKAASDTARQDAAIAKAEAVAIKLLREGRRLTPRNFKREGAYFYPSAVEWTVLALLRIGLGDRSVRHPTSAARMSEAFLSKIEAAARRVRAAFGETQAKLLLDYR